MVVRPCIRAALAGILAVVALSAPAAAQQRPQDEVFKDFVADGQIDPCKHTSDALREAQKEIPPDIEQYAPDYPAAVAAALEARARGDCTKKPAAEPEKPAAAAPAPAAPPAPPPSGSAPSGGGTSAPAPTIAEPPAPPALPAPAAAAPPPAAAESGALRRAASAEPGNDLPAPVIAMGGLALGLGLLALAWLAVARLGWGGERLAGARHAWDEAAFRAGGVWGDFLDWVRVGR